jgi:hypothetical protein
MTRQLQNNKYFTTPFSNWCRENKELDSKKAGITISDVDMIITHYRNNNRFIILEEKCNLQPIKFPQSKILMRLHNLCKADENYMGYYFVQFQNESPFDGKIYITDMSTGDKIEISEEQLTQFLLDFNFPEEKDNFWDEE